MNSLKEKDISVSSTDENYRNAMELISNKNYTAAIKSLKRLDKRDYLDKENLYYALFFCNTQIDDNENAMIYADKLIELNPQEGYLCKAAVFNRVDNSEEAFRFLLLAYQNGSENPQLESRIQELETKLGCEETNRIKSELGIE